MYFNFHFLGRLQFAQTEKVKFSSLEMVVSQTRESLVWVSRGHFRSELRTSLLSVMAFKEILRDALASCQPCESHFYKSNKCVQIIYT